MSESLADQLKAALAASQARANKGTPERAALDILTEQINKLVVVVEKNEPKPEAQDPQPSRGWQGSIPPGMQLLPSRVTPFGVWIRRAKVGDTFIVLTKDRSEGYQSGLYAQAKELKKGLMSERVIIARGPMNTPTAEPALYLTCVEYDENAKPVHDSGSGAGRKP